jgi:hypothetical protein
LSGQQVEGTRLSGGAGQEELNLTAKKKTINHRAPSAAKAQPKEKNNFHHEGTKDTKKEFSRKGAKGAKGAKTKR